MPSPAPLPGYAELHCLSNFSFQRGASHPKELVARAAQLGYQALALTDECSVAGVVRAWEAAKECGLHLIVGSEFVWGVLVAAAREEGNGEQGGERVLEVHEERLLAGVLTR